MTGALRQLAHLSGIYDDYWDQLGHRFETGAATDRALLAAMGFAVATDTEVEASLAAFRMESADRALPRWLILENDVATRHNLSRPAHDVRLKLEDGGVLILAAGAALELPALPLGIHVLDLDGNETTLLVGPASLPLPEPGWGITLPLYGLKTAKQGGLGDYADLRTAVTGLAAQGAQFVGLNPVHAVFPTDPTTVSPYSPSHRRRLNTVHLAVPQAHRIGGELIDYPAHVAAQRAALDDAFAAFEAEGGCAAFDSWREAEGPALEAFALHQALSDELGPYWCDWPVACQDRSSAEVAAFASRNAAAIRFHAWSQWLAETQLQAVADAAGSGRMRFGLYLDLAVGTHPFGAETWAEGEVFAGGVSLGAPPDAFSPDGQVWALAPFNPRALARMHFRPFAETLRRQFRYSKLLRIDHVLGFERAFWVPIEADAPGTYVVMPRDALLAVVRIEAARAGATVIGEDLGNVPDGLQDAMATSGVLGCRLVMFEQTEHGNFRPAGDYTEAALASFGTHDVPTWAGWRNASDITLRHELGYVSGGDLPNALDWRRTEVAGFDALAGSDGSDPDPMHEFVGSVKSRLVALQIEDILEIGAQENLPGTVDTYPNWRHRLPVTAAALAEHPAVARAAEIMTLSGRRE
ncbi:4-alpha-glucanotransferase [Tropicimonas sp.]|uniref:4-alpha-glucanotransferase n=1 Tax=Tropicimonas sp. TaxID=2067044 RepID=UPI003A83D07B